MHRPFTDEQLNIAADLVALQQATAQLLMESHTALYDITRRDAQRYVLLAALVIGWFIYLIVLAVASTGSSGFPDWLHFLFSLGCGAAIGRIATNAWGWMVRTHVAWEAMQHSTYTADYWRNLPAERALREARANINRIREAKVAPTAPKA